MHFIYLVSVLFALPLSNLETGVDNRALALEKRGPPTPEQLAELKAAKDSRKAAKEAAKNDPAAIAAKEAKKQADLEKQRLALLKQAEKNRLAEEAQKKARDKAAQDAAEKLARKSPAAIQPANLADTAHVVGHPDPVKLQFSEGFVEKHINNGIGSGIGKKKTVIEGPISAFEPGTAIPNPKGTGQRLTLTSQHSVDMRHFEKSPSGKGFVEIGSGRGRITVSGQQRGSVAIIDHFEKVIPSRSPMKVPGMVSPRTSGLARAASLVRGIRI